MGTAITMAVLVFYFTKDEKRTYSSEGLVNTGLVSGYNIESQGGSKTDYFYTSAELDNILNVISGYETNEELSARLLAEVMAAEVRTDELILAENYRDIQQEIGQPLWDSLRVPGSVEATYLKLIDERDRRGKDNVIHEILYGKHELFGLDHVSSVKVAREGKSDMIRLKYTTVDPAICQRTLALLIQIFTRKHREIKEGQTENVLSYFEEATNRSAARLRQAEEVLKRFREESKIINYYEQTRFIANKREDLYEEYMNELMNMVAADSAMRNIESQMANRNMLGTVNQDLLLKRDTMALIVGELAQLQLMGRDTMRVLDKIDRLRGDLDRLTQDIKSASDAVLSIQRTPKGTQIDNLLTEWLKNVLVMEDAAARLKVIERRKVEFEEVYDAFAPLGSKLKRLEREIDVAENEYMENLHSLNQARLHRQNMLMATNLKVVDIPFYPPGPDPSQRMMLVIVAFLAGFILTLGTVIAMEFFDRTLKRPTWATKATGLKLIGVVPRLERKTSKRPKVDPAFLEERPVSLLLQNIKIDLSQREVGRPVRILLLSTRPQEGKSMTGFLLAKYLRSYHSEVGFLTPDEPTETGYHPSFVEQLMDDEENFYYRLSGNIFEVKYGEDLVPEAKEYLSEYKYLITELPPLLHHPYPVEMIDAADLVILVCRANRIWNEADRQVLARLHKVAKSPIRLLLNGIAVDYLEESMGDLPKRRNIFRRAGKRFLKLGFSSRSKL